MGRGAWERGSSGVWRRGLRLGLRGGGAEKLKGFFMSLSQYRTLAI